MYYYIAWTIRQVHPNVINISRVPC